LALPEQPEQRSAALVDRVEHLRLVATSSLQCNTATVAVEVLAGKQPLYLRVVVARVLPDQAGMRPLTLVQTIPLELRAQTVVQEGLVLTPT
jgi:hypothetical protein